MKEKIEGLSQGCAVRVTEKVEDAREMARIAAIEGFSTIVAAGGDGTINEVVNGLAGTSAQLGILPLGTINVFAAELGIPQNNLQRAWDVIMEGHICELDLPLANNRHFVQLAGVGLDAEVVRLTKPDSKKVLGPISYLLSLSQVAANAPPRIHLEPSDSSRREGSFVLVGNGRFYGGPFVLFKEARHDDGFLDVLVFQNQSYWDLIRYFQAIAFGNHSQLPDVEYFQTREMLAYSDHDVPIELDGEFSGVLPCRFSFSPHKLQVLVPK